MRLVVSIHITIAVLTGTYYTAECTEAMQNTFLAQGNNNVPVVGLEHPT